MSLVLTKAFRLIDLIAAGHCQLEDIVIASGLSRSTTHRLLASLVKGNYLTLRDRQYSLGYRLLELGEAKKRTLNFIDVLHPVLERFARETRDTIHLAVLDGRDIVLLDRVFGDRELRINSFPGLRNKAFMTAVGKALIAQLPPRQWGGFLKDLPQNYTRSAEQIMADLKAAARLNVATDIDECNVGTCGVASTFRVNANLRAACSINGATVYFGDDRLRALAPTVRELASALENTLTSSFPSVALANF